MVENAFAIRRPSTATIRSLRERQGLGLAVQAHANEYVYPWSCGRGGGKYFNGRASYAPDEERSVVIDNRGKAERAKALDAVVVDLVVQIACLALLAYWTVILLQPLLGVMLWSVILAVLLYPAFGKLRLPRVLAALVLTVLTRAVLIGPVTWLGLSLAASVRILAERLGTGDIAVPAPPEGVKGWPLLGERVYAIWFLASTNLREALSQIAPQLKPVR